MVSEKQGQITRFIGEYSFLSNFFLVKVEYDGVEYPSVEHAYQAAKALPDTKHRKGDYVIGTWRELIRRAATPGSAKRLGGLLKQRGAQREDWYEVNLAVMEELLRCKFSKRRYPALVAALKYTGDRELIEGNDWGDRFWGMTHFGAFGDGEAMSYKLVGENHLGKLLMKIRSEVT